MDALGLIPARGGSRGIPRKNLVEVAGRSLLEWSCRAALESRELSRVAVSTGDDEIASAAARLGVDVIARPSELSADETPMLPVLAHALDASEGAEAAVLLQPTSPLRTARHIDDVVALLKDSGADSVVSVVAVPHNFGPSSLLRVVGGRLVPLDREGPTRRQAKEQLFARNGPAVLATLAETVRNGSLYGADSRPYEMSSEDSIDIDTMFELELAEFLLERRGRS
jgi:CMP-N,N'-diacetyllegionaminic acid synthase